MKKCNIKLWWNLLPEKKKDSYIGYTAMIIGFIIGIMIVFIWTN